MLCINFPLNSLKRLGAGHSLCACNLFSSLANKINKENSPAPEVGLYLNTKFTFKFLGEELEQCDVNLDLLIKIKLYSIFRL